jgi:hypothetical protein
VRNERFAKIIENIGENPEILIFLVIEGFTLRIPHYPFPYFLSMSSRVTASLLANGGSLILLSISIIGMPGLRFSLIAS